MSRKRKPANEPLTPQEVRFVELWCEEHNAKRAFLEAGFRAKSDGAARKAASLLLAKPNVQQHINRLQRMLIASSRIAHLREMEEHWPLARDYLARQIRQAEAEAEGKPGTTAHKR